MQKTVIFVAGFLALTTTLALSPKSLASETPQVTQSVQTVASVNDPAAVIATTSVQSSAESAPQTPVSLSIPSINLDDAIIPVGLTAGGAMAVPSGSTSNVGWYKNGVIPGDQGSAVLDAHVFAAFANLNKVNVGDSIYVTDSVGATRHFIVTKVETYALADLTSQMLFAPTSADDLNLITCAGQLTPDHSTYDHRLVIYTTLAQ